MDVSSYKRKHLLNVGLLMLEGGRKEGDEFKGLISVNMVVNVRADKESGGLRKLVLNPLAED